jgi:4-amino-4-deoxy-L-arabinose transferase-like glycosyltransferase
MTELATAPASTTGPDQTAPSSIATPTPTPTLPSAPATGTGHANGGRAAYALRRIWRGPDGDPSWARPALLGLLAATAVFYLWNLTSSGYANSFYSAAAQAGSDSWKAFFFGSSDAANSITVDKPPASLWFMALSVRIFGLSSFAILLPEVLMGVATVGVIYATVKRQFGAAAGLLAGTILALTPVAVLMFRFNNPDALLVLAMALAAWGTVRSIEESSPRWFALVGVFIGLAFLTKTLQAFLVVPGFALAYLVAARPPLLRRIWHTIIGGLAIVVSAGWWVAIVEMLPASMRPYVGGSQTNSFLELTFGYNGLGRINGEETGSVGGAGPRSGQVGLARLFDSENGGQISWLLPAALILLLVGLAYRARMPRTDARRAAYLVWGSWLVVTTLVFSFMAGIYHAYYTVALAPAIAALVAMGGAEAWERRDRWTGSVPLATVTLVTGVWGFVLLSRVTSWNGWLRVVVLALGLAAAAGFLLANRLHAKAVPAVLGVALVAGLLGPAAYSVATVATAHTGSIVLAGPATVGGGMGGPGGGGGMPPGAVPGGTGTTTRGGAQGGPPGAVPGAGGQGGGPGGLLNAALPSTAVVQALSADASSYTWVAAAVGSQNAAGLQLGTQLPVMAIGGFNGSDPSPTLAQFQAYVAAKQIHYFAAGGGFGQQNGGSRESSSIASWVSANFTPVTIGGSTFYDLTQPLSAGASTSGAATRTA